MEKTRNKLLVLAVLALSLTMAISMVAAKNDGNKGGGSKSSKSKSKSVKEFEKATPGKSNAQLHREKVKTVAKNLKEVAQEVEQTPATETEVGDAVASDNLEEIANDQDEQVDEVADEIEAVESRNKFKNFLVGSDYKNLGQLRSSLVHNRNDIRKLTQLISQTTDPAVKAELQTQLGELSAERDRIKTVITENESGFSLLGWVSRFLTGYDSTSVDDQEEDDLDQEIDDALNGENGDDTTPVDGETTPPGSETVPENTADSADSPSIPSN